MVTLTFTGKINIYRGLSTDIKPPAINGSQFFEMDTGNYYVYEFGLWTESTDLDFGIFDEWNEGDEFSGGSFWSGGDSVDGGNVGDPDYIPIDAEDAEDELILANIWR